jgi:hypothetical protein
MLANAAHQAAAAQVTDRLETRQADLRRSQAFCGARLRRGAVPQRAAIRRRRNRAAARLAATLVPGGLLSLISVNRYAMPYRAAFFRNDLAGALALLDSARR